MVNCGQAEWELESLRSPITCDWPGSERVWPTGTVLLGPGKCWLQEFLAGDWKEENCINCTLSSRCLLNSFLAKFGIPFVDLR